MYFSYKKFSKKEFVSKFTIMAHLNLTAGKTAKEQL